MSTSLQNSFESAASGSALRRGLAKALDDVLGFFFKPADLLPLGVMRVLGGLIVLYIYLVYSYDLYQLLGKDAWVSQRAVDALRHDAPVTEQPNDWGLKYDAARAPIPQTPEDALAWANFKHSRDPEHYPEPKDAQQAWEWAQYAHKWGVPRQETYTTGNPVWSVWYHVSDPRAMVAIHVALLLCIVLFTLGFCTRLTAVLVWVGTVSYVQRAPSTLFGMDTMVNIFLVYMMVAGVLGAAGATLSLDRVIADRWARRQSRRGRKALNSQLAAVSGNFILRLFQIHFCIIYLASGLSKLQGGAWWNGNATWGVMANPQFNPMHVGYYMALLLFLARHRWLWELFMHLNVLFTLAVEIGFPFLVWLPRWRWAMLLGAVMLHLGIAVVMGLVGFSMIMLVLLLSFVPAATMHRLVSAVTDGLRGLGEMVGLPPQRLGSQMALTR